MWLPKYTFPAAKSRGSRIAPFGAFPRHFPEVATCPWVFGNGKVAALREAVLDKIGQTPIFLPTIAVLRDLNHLSGSVGIALV